MSTQPFSTPTMPDGPFNFELALKHFSLETKRLEMTYRNLQERFHSVQSILEESNTRLAGKLAELDFVAHYLEAILHHISQGIIFIDLQGIVTTYNAAAQKLLQIPEKEFLFRPLADFFDDAFFGFSLKEVFATKQCPCGGVVSMNQKGQLIELEVETTFVHESASLSLGAPAIQFLADSRIAHLITRYYEDPSLAGAC